jgi:hypothetical protein
MLWPTPPMEVEMVEGLEVWRIGVCEGEGDAVEGT